MNQILIDYLGSNKTRLVDDWHSRLLTNLSRQGTASTEASLETIGRCYDHLMELLKCEKNLGSIASGERFSHHDKNGFRIKLPAFLETWLVGEEAIRDDLFLNPAYAHSFSEAEVGEFFEEIQRVFHRLMENRTGAFCEDCLKPIETKSSELCNSITHPHP